MFLMRQRSQGPGALLLTLLSEKTEEKLLRKKKDLSGLPFAFFGFSIMRAARVSAHVSSHVCVCVSVCVAAQRQRPHAVW